MRLCSECDEEFKPLYPGQVCCEGCSENVEEESGDTGAFDLRPSVLDTGDPVALQQFNMTLHDMMFAEPMANGEPDLELIVE